MNVQVRPQRDQWTGLLQRPELDNTKLEASVKKILQDVKEKGDEAIFHYTQQFDGIAINRLQASQQEINEAISTLPDDLKNAIQLAANNITAFHKKQLSVPEVIETMPGVLCWRKSIGIEKVGLYIPGGSAPLFSTILMLAIPAKLAGCKEIILCSPPGKDGKLHPAILYAAQLTGITKVFKTGGVQAIAAMAFGTASIPKTYKIFGPGNQYVTCAKQLVQQYGVAIDMPAGPSEVCVIADDSCVPAFVAADLLSQAEHGPDSQVLLVSPSEEVVKNVQQELKKQLAVLPRKELAEKALQNSKAIIAKDMQEAVELVNTYAAEHLILSCENDEAIAELIMNAGSIFLGNYSPESVGDYASGTNHTLPTNGYARMYSGVSVDSFVKKVTYQKLTKEGLHQIGKAVELMAEAEGLEAHKNAVTIRMK
ncbi:histidinol dehydrogenase [Danxiaibacter flavus]|uniref:Histidinol dehydrogenase n=1 Tax=Danxiaibacter flavus TaxID=3049108 RepID=A0ABV3ZDU5_9BACT|nr:histidinol dehydrogenase [Chitinophagaceae bacterium DXS]